MIDFEDGTPPGPQPGNPGIRLQRGSNWVYTDICNTRRDSDKPEWINFDTVQIGTSTSLPVSAPPPRWDFNDPDFDYDQWFEFMRTSWTVPGGNNYNLNTENSQGCEGFHISFILSNPIGYWNEDTNTTGCGVGACTYAGYICEIEEDSD